MQPTNKFAELLHIWTTVRQQVPSEFGIHLLPVRLQCIAVHSFAEARLQWQLALECLVEWVRSIVLNALVI